MALNADLHILTQPGSTGNQTYSLASNFDPKAVIVWANAVAADGSVADWAYGIGFGTYRGATVQQRFTAMRGMDAQTSADNARGQGSNALLVLQTNSAGAATRDLEITLVSMLTGSTSNVVLNWVNLHTTASIRVFMLVLGGSDIADALVDGLTIGTASATQDETVVAGFGKPELTFFMGNGASAEVASSPMQHFGFAKQGEAGRGLAFSVIDGNTASLTALRQRSDRCLMDLLATGSSTATDRAIGGLDTTVGNWPTDGFRIVWDTTPANADVVSYLALRTTAQIATGSNTAVTGGSPPVTQDNACGFAPKAGLVFSWGLAASSAIQAADADQVGLGLGATDGTDQAWAGLTEDDAAGTMVSKQQQETDHILANYTPAPALQSSATGSFSGNNFRLTWDDLDTVAREYQWLALGDAAGSVTVAPAASDAVGTVVAPTVVLGGLAIAPSASAAAAAIVAPAVVLGGLTLAPGAATAPGVTADPAVALGGLAVAPSAADASGAAVDPLAVLGGLTLAPDAATAAGGAIDPTVDIPNGYTIAPPAATAAGAALDPIVVLAGLTLVPLVLDAAGGAVDPLVLLGGLALEPGAATAAATTAGPEWPVPAVPLATFAAGARPLALAAPARGLTVVAAARPLTFAGRTG